MDNLFRTYLPNDRGISAADLNNRGIALTKVIHNAPTFVADCDTLDLPRTGKIYSNFPGRSVAPTTTAPSPWAATVSGTTLTLLPGTINSVVPSNIFAEFTITGSGIEFVVVTLSITSDSPNSALISIESTPPIPSLTTEGSVPAEAKDVVAIVNDGVVYQIRNTNIYAQSYEVFRNPVAAPVYGELNYVPWYRWEILES